MSLFVFILNRALLCCLHWNYFSIAVVDFQDWTDLYKTIWSESQCFPGTRSDQTLWQPSERRFCVNSLSRFVLSGMYARHCPSGGTQQWTKVLPALDLAIWHLTFSLLKSAVSSAHTNSLLTVYLEIEMTFAIDLCARSHCASPTLLITQGLYVPLKFY